jgi:hypothetical protein
MKDIISDLEFKAINENYIYNTVAFFMENEIFFGVVANIEAVEFEPDLPQSIKKSFGEFTMFMLANYTFESINITEDSIEFEAGFGRENIGSVVTIPLFAILQLVVDDEVILLNQCAKSKELINNMKIKPQNSMEALLSNPKNKKFIKK